MLGKLYFENINIPLKEYLAQDLSNYKIVTAWFMNNFNQPTNISSITEGIELVDLYKKILNTTNELPTVGDQENMFYLNAIGQAVINQRLNLQTQGLSVR